MLSGNDVLGRTMWLGLIAAIYACGIALLVCCGDPPPVHAWFAFFGLTAATGVQVVLTVRR